MTKPLPLNGPGFTESPTLVLADSLVTVSLMMIEDDMMLGMDNGDRHETVEDFGVLWFSPLGKKMPGEVSEKNVLLAGEDRQVIQADGSCSRELNKPLPLVVPFLVQFHNSTPFSLAIT